MCKNVHIYKIATILTLNTWPFGCIFGTPGALLNRIVHLKAMVSSKSTRQGLYVLLVHPTVFQYRK